ncbi:MAG: hypothetical protein H6742_21120 [Alphaproteobacteria bacterium]|nr:hypothetical protein [Alphaproteobacteria bacterium]
MHSLISLLLAGPALADEPPVALAGVPFLAYPGETIILDGSESYDPDGQSLTYAWDQVAGPRVDLVDDDKARPSFTPDEGGTYTFSLVVDDGLSASDPDEVDVIVVDPAIGSDVDGGGGCATVPAAPGVLGLLFALLGLRRRER